ncbi:hypothetical protein AMTRI_Chr05g56700 [Amborella trichopoda]
MCFATTSTFMCFATITTDLGQFFFLNLLDFCYYVLLVLVIVDQWITGIEYDHNYSHIIMHNRSWHKWELVTPFIFTY